ncbi:MAG: 50S ribosomal protein L15 [Candidatus Moranbacteria bacterium RIFCSPHIGHO2_02_FULL_40_12b]|nr:MAG: 50S ribosomal protein L15 [Candidatus Moranbacteria bacterium RIFCSPHIGHO2_02_FULL_40_12b]OGI22935.1 MAG: 50S ribosomal protein L15 [Candidatus Moranbacteria bacterium RIFCSPHIGHO2_12_FULL_40_10]
MQIHQLKLNKRKSRKRVGRGGKRGTFSGRGMKGQKARSGAKIDPLFEGGRSSLVERLKKTRGFKSPHGKKININLNDLERIFKGGDTIDAESLIKAGLVGKIESKRGIKILGGGSTSKKLIIGKNILLSKSAKAVIEKAGK